MQEFPTLRVEMQGVQYHVVHAFIDAMDEIKEFAAQAIQASMNELRQGGLEHIIIATVERTMNEAIHEGIQEAVKDAVYEYFCSGEGMKFISAAIMNSLRGEGKG